MANLNELFNQSAGRSFWAERTDRELLELELTTTDPEALQGISEEMPPVQGVYVELGYDVSGRPNGKVRCVYCKRKNHFHGVVVRDEAGGRYLVGRDCALTRHGVVYGTLVKDYDEAVSRQEALKRQARFHALRKEMSAYMRTARAEPSIAAFDRIRSELAGLLIEEHWGELSRLVRSGDGILRHTQRVRDYAAEERRKDEQPEPIRTKLKKAKGLGGLMPIWKEVEVLGCRVEGDALFALGGSVAKAFEEIEGELSSAMNVLADANTSTRAISLAFVALQNVLGRVEAEQARIQSGAAFFAETNLRNVAIWCQARMPNTRIQVEARGRTLAVSDSWHRYVVSLPDDYRVPGEGLVSILREAVALQPKKAA